MGGILERMVVPLKLDELEKHVLSSHELVLGTMTHRLAGAEAAVATERSMVNAGCAVPDSKVN